MLNKLERLLAQKRSLEWLKQRNCEVYDKHIRNIQEEIEKEKAKTASDLNMEKVQP